MKTKVLVPFDGSSFSKAVFLTLKKLFNPRDYTMTLLEVAPVPEELEEMQEGVPVGWAERVGYWALPESSRQALAADKAAYIEEIWQENTGYVLQGMQEAKQELEAAGFEVVTSVRFGDPVREISDFVELGKIDLVTMATHGRSGLSRMVMGSVAEKVLRNLRIPVMMVRPEVTLADEMLPVFEVADAIS